MTDRLLPERVRGAIHEAFTDSASAGFPFTKPVVTIANFGELLPSFEFSVVLIDNVVASTLETVHGLSIADGAFVFTCEFAPVRREQPGVEGLVGRYLPTQRRSWPTVHYDAKYLARIAEIVDPHSPALADLRHWNRRLPLAARMRRLLLAFLGRTDTVYRDDAFNQLDDIARTLFTQYAQVILLSAREREPHGTALPSPAGPVNALEPGRPVSVEEWSGRVEAVDYVNGTFEAMLSAQGGQRPNRLVRFSLSVLPTPDVQRVQPGSGVVWKITEEVHYDGPSQTATVRLVPADPWTDNDLDAAADIGRRLFDSLR